MPRTARAQTTRPGSAGYGRRLTRRRLRTHRRAPRTALGVLWARTRQAASGSAQARRLVRRFFRRALDDHRQWSVGRLDRRDVAPGADEIQRAPLDLVVDA